MAKRPTLPTFEPFLRTDPMDLRIRRLDANLPVPAYAHEGDAGLDLYAAERVVLEPLSRAFVRTGIAVAIPDGFAGFVQPRSGLAIRRGLSFVNTPGLIDSHYRGEIKIIAINLDPKSTLTLERGERVAQLVIQRVERVSVLEVDDLGDTARGTGGFGSTGSS